jgi:CheY-like chemotaxis protein
MKTIKNTLIIDDDQVLITLIRLLVRKNEYFENCKDFQNGKKALDYIQNILDNNQELPDLILLDLNMPIMDGWEFLDILSSLPLEREIPVYIVTSSIDPNDLEKADSYKMIKGYMMKPVTPGKLIDILENITA